MAGQEKALARYLKPDLLIVDDMGMKNLPRQSGEVLFEIILRRYETRSTVMTSNRPLEDWGKLIGDVPSATAILDRFLHHAEVLAFQGKSYRLRNQPPPPAPPPDTAEDGSNAAPSARRLETQKRRLDAAFRNARRLPRVTVLTKIRSLQPRLPNSARPWRHFNRPMTASDRQILMGCYRRSKGKPDAWRRRSRFA